MNKKNHLSTTRSILVTSAVAALLVLGARFSAVQAAENISQPGTEIVPLVLAATDGMERRQDRREDRRDDRGDRRDMRQDCRQEKGVGKDKRDCKQEERQERRESGND